MSAAAEWFAKEEENEKYRERMGRAREVAEHKQLSKIGATARARLQRMPAWISAYCQCFTEDHHA